ncbi:MAG: FAD-binding oxidoreductase [Bacteroidota bacterium]|nr:FAD-binding oxidoreductase [Bacteroidota bacterium]
MISIWEKETFFAPQDVIIVGSGFVGLWSALYLKKKAPKLKISILERGLIPAGASTRNAGFACFGSLSELMHDAQISGTDKMLELVELRYKGLEKIQKYFTDGSIDFEINGGYELYDNSLVDTETLTTNIEYINALLKPITGTKKTFKLNDEKIESFGFGNTRHLVRNNLEGSLHSGKLLQALLQQVQTMGVQVFNAIEVKTYNLYDENIEIETNKQLPFSTRKLLVCTNAFAQELLPDLDIVPARGQVLLTSSIKNLPWKGTFHSDEGFYYFRNLDNKVLLGGARNKAFEDEATKDLQTTSIIQNELERYLDKIILPKHKGLYTIENRWSGIMGMGSEKMPIVKQALPNVFCAVRMSGMGVALAPEVGQQVAKMMLD